MHSLRNITQRNTISTESHRTRNVIIIGVIKLFIFNNMNN